MNFQTMHQRAAQIRICLQKKKHQHAAKITNMWLKCKFSNDCADAIVILLMMQQLVRAKNNQHATRMPPYVNETNLSQSII